MRLAPVGGNTTLLLDLDAAAGAGLVGVCHVDEGGVVGAWPVCRRWGGAGRPLQ
jgi:hypothetical protein